MGFLKKFFGIERKEDNNGKKTDKQEPLFVTEDEEQSFENSIYGQLQIYEAEIEYIREVLPEAGDSLEKQVALLTKLLEVKNNEDDLEIRECFANFKKQYEEARRLAEGEYTLRELEAQNSMMDKSFETSLEKRGITKRDLDSFINYISKIQDKVNDSESAGAPILTNVQRQKFNNLSLKSEYRLKMLELMYLTQYRNGDIEVNPFRDLSVTKQKIFSKLFWQDAQKAGEQYEYLSHYEDLFNEYNDHYFFRIDEMAKRLNEQIRNVRMVEDFSIRQLFDSSTSETESFKFLKEFISFKVTLNEMRDKKQVFQEDKDRQEERRRKQEEEERLKKAQDEENERRAKAQEQEQLEKLRNMTNSEICKKIDEIDSDLTATGSRFINIYEFQKSVAKAKGLIDSDIDIKNSQLYYYNVGPTTLLQILKNANEKGVNYIVYPSSQESDVPFTFVVSKSDKDVTKGEEFPIVPFSRNSYANSLKVLGQSFDIFTLKMIEGKIKDSDEEYLHTSRNEDTALYDLRIGKYFDDTEDHFYKARRRILQAIKEVKSELAEIASSEEMIQNILCYLKLPVMTNMIPILEKLKSADVDVFLEPVPSSNRNDKNRENVHIYFKRDDLEKVNQVLEEEPNRGVIGVKSDKNIIGQSIIDRIVWPEEKEK